MVESHEYRVQSGSKSHFSHVGKYRYLKVFTKCDILGGYGKNNIKIDVEIMKNESLFLTNGQKSFYTHAKSMEPCWKYCIVPWYHHACTAQSIIKLISA